MRTVHKYPFEITDEFTVTLPQRHKVVHVEKQHGAPTMWVEVDTEAPTVEFTFHVEGTGHPIANGMTEHVGSLLDGPFVWHLYENISDRMDIPFES